MKLRFYVDVLIAAFMVWQSAGAAEPDRIYYLFGALFLLIHAYGRRILAELEATKAGPE